MQKGSGVVVFNLRTGDIFLADVQHLKNDHDKYFPLPTRQILFFSSVKIAETIIVNMSKADGQEK